LGLGVLQTNYIVNFAENYTGLRSSVNFAVNYTDPNLSVTCR